MDTAKRSRRQRGVFPRGDKWYIRYSFHGKIRYEAIGKRYDDAVRDYYSRKTQIETGEYERNFGFKAGKEKAPTFSELAERFLVEYCDAPGKKPSLRRNYQTNLKALLPVFGQMRLDAINQWNVRKFQKDRSKQKARMTGNKVSPKTVNREMAAIKRMFNIAKSWGLVKDNPVIGVEMLPIKQTKFEYLMPDECQRLIEAAEDYIRPILILAIHTGMRKGEILELMWDQVDLQNWIIRLDEGKTVKDEPEYVPLDETACRTLSGLKRRGKYVFVKEKGKGRLYDVRNPLKKTLERSGIAEERRRAGKPSFRFHDLRHTTASNMVMAGIRLEVVQKQLRHRSIETTQKYATCHSTL